MISYVFKTDFVWENLIDNVSSKSITDIISRFLLIEKALYDEKNELYLVSKIKKFIYLYVS